MGLLSKLLLAVLSAAYYWNSATAQKTTAVCQPSIYDWMINTMGQSPCVVASFVEGACSDSVFNIAALPAGRHYVGPSEPDFATPCICSSVAYSLVSACGICQGATETQKWSSWITNCTGKVDAHGYPQSVPSGTSVPFWAYQDVVTTDEFDPNTAQTDAAKDRPDVGPNGSTVSATHKSKPIGAIVGGVVGGIFFLGLVGVLGTYCILKRSRSRQAPSAAYTNHATPAPSYMTAVAEPQHIVTPYPLSPSAGAPLLYDNTGGYTLSEKPYDPNDPSTYPFGSTPGVYYDIVPRSASGPPASVYTSVPSIAPNPYEKHYSPSPAPLVPNRGGYTGAPEI